MGQAGRIEPRMSYRDEVEAQKNHRAALEQRLRELREKLAALRPMEHEAAELEQYIAETDCDLAAARAKQPLPLLSQVRIASPCKESWDDMVGDEHVRHCGRCDKDVYDLSSLTKDQAESLLRERGADLCARLYRRSDGTVLTSDCPVGQRRKRIKNVAAAVAASVTATAVGLGLYASFERTMGEARMGGVVGAPVSQLTPPDRDPDAARLGRVAPPREAPAESMPPTFD